MSIELCVLCSQLLLYLFLALAIIRQKLLSKYAARPNKTNEMKCNFFVILLSKPRLAKSAKESAAREGQLQSASRALLQLQFVNKPARNKAPEQNVSLHCLKLCACVCAYVCVCV